MALQGKSPAAGHVFHPSSNLCLFRQRLVPGQAVPHHPLDQIHGTVTMKKTPHKPYLSSWFMCVLLHMIPQAFHRIFSQRWQPILSGHCQQCTLLWLRGPHRAAEGGKSFLFFSEGPGVGTPECQGTSIMWVIFTQSKN